MLSLSQSLQFILLRLSKTNSGTTLLAHLHARLRAARRGSVMTSLFRRAQGGAFLHLSPWAGRFHSVATICSSTNSYRLRLADAYAFRLLARRSALRLVLRRARGRSRCHGSRNLLACLLPLGRGTRHAHTRRYRRRHGTGEDVRRLSFAYGLGMGNYCIPAASPFHSLFSHFSALLFPPLPCSHPRFAPGFVASAFLS